jgi:hypothetical protein
MAQGTVPQPEEHREGAEPGHMVLVPMFIPEGYTTTGLSFALLPWGSPATVGAITYPAATPTEQQLVVASEWPLPWIETVSRMERKSIERLCMDRYCGDLLLATGQLTLWDLQEGEAPDFRAESDRGSIGVELTQLTIPTRRHAHALMRALRLRIASEDRRRLLRRPSMAQDGLNRCRLTWCGHSSDQRSTGVGDCHTGARRPTQGPIRPWYARAARGSAGGSRSAQRAGPRPGPCAPGPHGRALGPDPRGDGDGPSARSVPGALRAVGPPVR